MPGYTENSIVILRDFDTVFDLTNNIELWPQLFTEYEKAVVLERNGNEVLFSLTTYPEGERPSRTWVSRRIIDKPGKQATAERVEKAFPFEDMKIHWTYEELPKNVGVVMTWIQKFEPAEGAWSTEKLESFLNRNTRTQMRAIKEKVEAWPAMSLTTNAV
ncbi:MAG: SRPBCC family protein [Chroococcidiopsidaceae cyanobacterium CP_BM_RX_35]|nr:SRPBCC family protein [Chroococcidiopsidaceae cyanobacterium CP_BM_RX_35]